MNSDKQSYMAFVTKIFSTKWEHGYKFLYLSILICFSIISYYHLNFGFKMSSDSYAYSKWADDLIKLDFNLYSYYSQNTFINPNYIYTIPVLLIALSKFFFGTEWQYAFMIFNLILVFFSLIIFSNSLLMLKVRPLIISLAMPLLTLSVDLLTWPRYILTDVIFSFLIMLSIYLMIKGIIKDKFDFLPLFFIIILLFLSRPTSLPFIFAIVVFIVMLKIKINHSPKLILLFIFMLFIFTPFIFAILYQLMKINLNSNAQVIFLIEMIEAGMVIHDRPETWVDTPNTFIDLVYIYFMRFLFFFKPYAESYSIIHIVLNSLQTFFIFLSLTIWVLITVNSKAIHKTVALILFISFSVAAFHTFTLIDYDWRYRFPILMPLIMIFPISIEIFIRKISSRNF
jgi:hypothetical protein